MEMEPDLMVVDPEEGEWGPADAECTLSTDMLKEDTMSTNPEDIITPAWDIHAGATLEASSPACSEASEDTGEVEKEEDGE